MTKGELKKYVAPVAVGLAVNIVAAVIYNSLKPYAQSTPWSTVLMLLGIAVANIAYSFVLIRVVKRHETELFLKRTAQHHSFAHNARNLAVKIMERKPADITTKKSEPPMAITGQSHYAFKEDFALLLEALAHMFQHMAPTDVKVWACIRERRSDDSYWTWARTSRCETTRQEFTEPLHKDSKTIQNLKKSYVERKDCVIITGSKSPEWHSMSNDEYAEDLSVLMGAVLSRSWGGNGFEDPKLNWILCVNADKEGVFKRDHINLMKTCNDIFSWLLNSFIRYDAQQTGREPTEKSTPDIVD